MDGNPGMDMTLAAQGLVNLYVNMDSNSRVMFIRLLIAKMKDDEVDFVLQVIHLRQKAENGEPGDVSKFLNIELKQEPVECDADSYFQSTSWWNTDNEMKDHGVFGEGLEGVPKAEKAEKIKTEKREKILDKPHYFCDICDEKYAKKDDLISHMEAEHDGVPQPAPNKKVTVPKEKKFYYCDKCDKKCAKKSDLTSHVETIHEGIRYPCDQCEYQATKKYNLQAHIKRVHLGITPEMREKRFICDRCSKKFAHRCDLIRHIREVHDKIHEGVFYPCEECEYKATKKWHLKVHVEATHKGIRYPCGQCSYEAKTKQTLQRHVESIHEGIRYPCQFCDYKATQNVCLKKHIQLNHRGII